MADSGRGNPPNGSGDNTGDKRDWLKTLGWAAALGLGAWGASIVFGKKAPPIRLFWDIESARCNIPYPVRLEQCVAYLRDVAGSNGLQAETEYRIKVVCGGNTVNCSAARCFHGMKLCSSQIRDTWTAGQSRLTRADGVLLQCCWKGTNERHRANDIIIQDLKKAFKGATSRTTFLIVTTDDNLRKRAQSVVERPNIQKVIFHPLDPQGPVWPPGFAAYETKSIRQGVEDDDDGCMDD